MIARGEQNKKGKAESCAEHNLNSVIVKLSLLALTMTIYCILSVSSIYATSDKLSVKKKVTISIEPDVFLTIPDDQWSIKKAFENRSPFPIITQRQIILGPNNAQLYLDIWKHPPKEYESNIVKKLLNAVIKQNSDAELVSLTNQEGRSIAIVDFPKSVFAPRRIQIIAEGENQAVRLMYVMSDQGTSFDQVCEIIQSFSTDGLTFSDLIIPTHLFPEDNETLEIQRSQDCCGFHDPNSNPFLCYPCGNCTWWAKYRRSDIPCTGNPSEWISEAQAAEWPTGSTPVVGAIAVSNTHVAFVEEVSGNSYRFSEMWYPDGCDNICCNVCTDHWHSSGYSFIYTPDQSECCLCP